MRKNNKQKGDYGEEAAVNYLTSKGYKIISRNYRKRCGEIDIIAKDGEYIVFVEVKYRSTLSFGMPREAVTKTKINCLIKAANCYISENQLSGTDMRFDVIEIIGVKQLSVEHIIAAF